MSIIIRDEQTQQEFPVNITFFPDKTSQVWKLSDDILKSINSFITIIWEFENEGEIMQVSQLAFLLRTLQTTNTTIISSTISLHIPYLPYGRQDKPINNASTFALCIFMQIINSFKSLFHTITTLDAHNAAEIYPIKSLSPNQYIQRAINETQCDLVCFPDKGAGERGYDTFGKPFFCLNKKRNQETGEITGMYIEHDLYNLKGKKILIGDDICDGGRTFVEAAKILYSEGVKNVHLYVTHGIFSKGLQVLRDSGISRIFTWKGEQ